MQIWAYWVIHSPEYGWPGEDSIVRAMRQAASATVTDGRRRKGPVPPMPKSTRQSPGSVVPRIAKMSQADRIHRLLLDMRAEGAVQTVKAMQVDAIHDRDSISLRAEIAGMTVNQYKYRKRRGHQLLGRMLANSLSKG